MTRPDYAWQLPEAIERRLGRESYGAQRAIHEQQHLLLILHEPPQTASGARDHAVFLRTPDGAWSFQGQPDGEPALQRLLDAFQERLSTGLAAYDQADDAADLFALIERARPVARAAGNLHAALQAAREAVKGDAGLITARDRAVDIQRGLELLLADAQLALNFRLAQQAEAQTRAALANHRAQEKLNTLAAWTLPLMAVAAVFGMNLLNGGETLGAWLFWAVLVAGMFVGWWVKVWVQRPAPAEKKKALSSAKGRSVGKPLRR
jgi:hypothetical protein